MKRELRIFFSALMFYTRIPCPAWVSHGDGLSGISDMRLSTKYFPLIGLIVGGTAYGVLAAGMALFSLPVAVLLSMTATLLLTGALHEDGFADTCDGFGGGWDRERILEIMKDSRTGVYGVVGLVLILLLKLFLTIELVQIYPPGGSVIGLLLVSSHSLSRLAASSLIFTHSYVRDRAGSKAWPVAGSMSLLSLLIGGLFGLLPFIGFLIAVESLWPSLALVPLIAAIGWLGRYFKRRIGGYTGDCLGAAQQVTEIVFLASVVGLWTSI